MPALVGIGAVCLAAGVWMIGKPAIAAARVDAPRWELAARMAIATALVLLITWVAAAIGPNLSGLAAAFPLFAMVLAVFAHRHQGGPAARGVMRGLLLGLFGFVGFFATVSLLVTRIGLASTFSIALIVNLVIHGAAYLVLRRHRV
jgi:uncharacterized membrane protein (GlpM family)